MTEKELDFINPKKRGGVPRPLTFIHKIKAGKAETERFNLFQGTITTGDKYEADEIGINTQAETLIDQITTGIKTVGRLTALEKLYLFSYFSLLLYLQAFITTVFTYRGA